MPATVEPPEPPSPVVLFPPPDVLDVSEPVVELLDPLDPVVAEPPGSEVLEPPQAVATAAAMMKPNCAQPRAGRVFIGTSARSLPRY